MDVTEIMSTARYPTLSMIIPVLDGLRHLLERSTGGLDGLRGILLRLLAEKFGDVFANDDLCISTAVDPRFKLAHFDNDERRLRAMTATVKAMEGVNESSTTPPAADAQSTSSSAPVTSNLILCIASSNARTANSLRHEFDLYAAKSPISRDACPLEWWK